MERNLLTKDEGAEDDSRKNGDVICSWYLRKICQARVLLFISSVDLHGFFAASEHLADFFLAQCAERLVATQHSDRNVMLRELCLCSAAPHGLDALGDECVGVHAAEAFKVALEVGLRRLALVANGVSHILKVVARWASFEEMRASSIYGADEQTHAEGALVRVERLCLGLALDLSDEALARVLRAVDVRVVEAGVAHELRQEASICSHS